MSDTDHAHALAAYKAGINVGAREERARIREALEAEYEKVKERNADIVGRYDIRTMGMLSGLAAAIGLTEPEDADGQ